MPKDSVSVSSFHPISAGSTKLVHRRSDVVEAWCAAVTCIILKLREARVPVRTVLTNGHLEREMKFLLGMAAEKSGRHLCFVEKSFSKVPIDLVAFTDSRNTRRNVKPAFWVETKSSFSRKCEDQRKQVKRVHAQIKKYVEKLCDTEHHSFLECPIYVVHFVMSLPESDKHPLVLGSRFTPNRATPVSAKELELQYEKLFAQSTHFELQRVASFTLIDGPKTEVAIVKLRSKTESVRGAKRRGKRPGKNRLARKRGTRRS